MPQCDTSPVTRVLAPEPACWVLKETEKWKPMPILDQKKLRAELEASGEKEVRQKLAVGVYGSWKIKTIEGWLREKEEARASVAADDAKTQAKQTLSWTRISVIATVVSALAAVVALWFSK